MSDELVERVARALVSTDSRLKGQEDRLWKIYANDARAAIAIALEEAAKEITALTAENERLRAALEDVRDSGLLHGPTVLHDETLSAVHAALNEEPRT
jgi:hypothetical protein